MSNRSKDAKNGFSGNFYIDIVIRKKSQLFFSIEKNNFENENIFLKMSKIFSKDFEIFWFFINENFEFSLMKCGKFQNPYWNFQIFFVFQNYFFRSKKSWDFFSNHYIDVKFSEESIFHILFVVWAVWGAQNLPWSQNHHFPHEIQPSTI